MVSIPYKNYSAKLGRHSSLGRVAIYACNHSTNLPFPLELDSFLLLHSLHLGIMLILNFLELNPMILLRSRKLAAFSAQLVAGGFNVQPQALHSHAKLQGVRHKVIIHQRTHDICWFHPFETSLRG